MMFRWSQGGLTMERSLAWPPNATTTPCDDTHEGWHNYETWAVALWLANDEGSYR